MTRPAISTDVEVRARYSQGAGIYRIVPWGVAHPVSLAELRAVLATARDLGIPVTPRGAGSAMPGNNVTSGLVLDLTGFEPGRCVVDPATSRATLSPSVSLGHLNRIGKVHSLALPVDPSSGAWATLGGMVSTNAAGPHTLRSGSIRGWVHRLTLETSDGPLDLARGADPDPRHPVIARWRSQAEPVIRRHAAAIRRRFPAVRKNSAGYGINYYSESGDLVDLVVGAEGTLGVVTDVEVRLAPVPRERASLRVAVRARADLPGIIEIIRRGNPATLEFLDQSFLRFVDAASFAPGDSALLRRAGGLLLADFEGEDPGDVAARATSARTAVAATVLDAQVAGDSREIEALWAVRHAASPILAGLSDGRRSLQVIEDGCVPVSRLADYLDAVERIAAGESVDVVMFGHAGDGHVHVNLLPDVSRSDWTDRVRKIFDAVSDTVIAIGGTPSGEHGVGRLRAGLLTELYGAEVMESFRAVKAAFDPDGRSNPGVILGGGDPIAQLKVGADAVTLPGDVDAYLAAIESEARWAESRWLSH